MKKIILILIAGFIPFVGSAFAAPKPTATPRPTPTPLPTPVPTPTPLVVGSANQTINFTSGTNSYSPITVGSDTSSTNNLVTVINTNTLLTNSGSLSVGQNGSGNSMVISNGGMVADATGYIGSSNTSLNNSVLVTGAGSTWTNSGTLTVGSFGGGTLTVANGGLVAASGITIAASNGSTGTLNIGRFGTNDTAGTITAATIAFGSGTGTINFNQSDSTTLTSSISGAGSVNQLGAGSTTLSGSNTNSGTTTISAGTLLANNTAGSALGTSVVTVSGNGTLGGNGSIGGATTIATGGNLTPGSGGVGSLTFTNGLTLQGGAATTFRINSTNNFTSINLIGSTLSYGGDLVFNITSYTPAAGDAFTLFNLTGGATESGDFSSVSAGSLIFTDANGIWSATDGSLTYQFSDSTGQLTVQSAPEPSTYVLFGLGAIGLLMVMRRKKSA